MQNQEKIVNMFDEIAPTYDRANRAMSFGVDSSWRKSACEIVLRKIKKEEINIVDVACGTGDMMGIWSQISKKFNKNIKEIVGVDPSKGMLEVAKKKFKDFKFIEAKADDTGLKSEFGDILSISYGIRNVINREGALKEFNRVLKDGGYLVVLEFTKNQDSGFIGKIRDFYLKNIVPKIGGFISKNKDAYEYLPNSIENFLQTDSFKDELINSGFEVELIKGYSFDISTLFVARKVKSL